MSAAMLQTPVASCRTSFSGAPLRVRAPVRAPLVLRRAAVADSEVKPAPKAGEGKKEAWKVPSLDPNTPSPIFGGSTGGLLRKAQVRAWLEASCCNSTRTRERRLSIVCRAQIEEFYVITWEAKKEQIFEMPTGGAAIMRSGPNLLKLARKEQCLALLTQLRNKFKTDGQIYRVFPNGEVQYLHPKDGVYPEKVNAGRQAVRAALCAHHAAL